MCLCESTDWIHAVAAHLALFRLFSKRGLPAPIWLHMFRENSPNKMALLWTTQTKTNPQWWKKYKYKKKGTLQNSGVICFQQTDFCNSYSRIFVMNPDKEHRGKSLNAYSVEIFIFFPIYFSHLNAQYQVKSKYKNKTEKDCILKWGDKCTNQNLI